MNSKEHSGILGGGTEERGVEEENILGDEGGSDGVRSTEGSVSGGGYHSIHLMLGLSTDLMLTPSNFGQHHQSQYQQNQHTYQQQQQSPQQQQQPTPQQQQHYQAMPPSQPSSTQPASVPTSRSPQHLVHVSTTIRTNNNTNNNIQVQQPRHDHQHYAHLTPCNPPPIEANNNNNNVPNVSVEQIHGQQAYQGTQQLVASSIKSVHANDSIENNSTLAAAMSTINSTSIQEQQHSMSVKRKLDADSASPSAAYHAVNSTSSVTSTAVTTSGTGKINFLRKTIL